MDDKLAEVTQQRALPGWTLSQWDDRLIEHAGVGVTILDRDGRVVFYNQWAANRLDHKPISAQMSETITEEKSRILASTRC